MKRWLAALLLAGFGAGAVLLLLRSQPAILPAAERRDDELFVAWRAGAVGADVAAIEAYLAREGVGDVLPLADLLRSDARSTSGRAPATRSASVSIR